MKPVTMFVLESCPYCKEALRWMEELKAENVHYDRVAFTIVDEQLHPEISRQYSYYYVPTYFVNGIKVHEGAATKDIVRNVFEKALEP